jgi:Family of unknown function (DUF6335)
MAKRKAAGTTRRKARKSSGARPARAAARKTAGRKSSAKKTARRKKTASSAKRTAKTKKTTRARVATKAVAARKPVARKSRAVTARKAPALDRARRTVQGDDIVPTPPSSLNMDRTASAARTGRRELRERLNEHTESSPALTAGDVDADWEGAYSSGDEAPGGDNPTPDQDVVDDIGKAVGVQYEDNEELKGEAKIAKRDKHRWELDPASAEDYEDH